MTDLALFTIGFGILATCLLVTIGITIGTSQPDDSEVTKSGTDHAD